MLEWLPANGELGGKWPRLLSLCYLQTILYRCWVSVLMSLSSLWEPKGGAARLQGEFRVLVAGVEADVWCCVIPVLKWLAAVGELPVIQGSV